MDQALFRVEQMIKEGMDILDIGGESTRPGALAVSAQEELDRIIPVIEAIKKNFDKGLWNKTMVKMAVRKGVITKDLECEHYFEKATNYLFEVMLWN